MLPPFPERLLQFAVRGFLLFPLVYPGNLIAQMDIAHIRKIAMIRARVIRRNAPAHTIRYSPIDDYPNLRIFNDHSLNMFLIRPPK